MPTIPFKKGVSYYNEWLKTLTPEEKKQHLSERRVRKAQRKKEKAMLASWEAVAMEQQAKWLALFNNRAAEILENGNANDFAIVFDRIIGKPKDKVEQDVKQDLTISWEQDKKSK